MSVFRRNPVTEQIVVFASDRDNRPRQTIDSSKVKQFSHEQPEHLHFVQEMNQKHHQHYLKSKIQALENGKQEL